MTFRNTNWSDENARLEPQVSTGNTSYYIKGFRYDTIKYFGGIWKEDGVLTDLCYCTSSNQVCVGATHCNPASACPTQTECSDGNTEDFTAFDKYAIRGMKAYRNSDG